MTITDKLITIADNTSAVAEAVNAAMTTDNGTVIRISDIADAPIKIQTEPGAVVKACGKNLIETASVDAEADKNKVLFQGSVTGDFVFSCLFNYSEIKTPTAAQFEFTVNGAVQYMARGSETNYIIKKISGTLTKVRYLNWGYGVGTVDNLQLECGSTATDYESYQDPQTATADANGNVEGIEIFRPTMTIVADQPLECKYFPSSSDIYDKYLRLKAEEQDLSNMIKGE